MSAPSSCTTKPPPYSTETENPYTLADIPQISFEVAQTLQTGQAVNNVFIRPRPIVATFIIDPSLKCPSQGPSSRWERGERQRQQRRRRGRDRHGGWHHHGHSSDDDEGEINALFQTHGGGCNLNIGVACPDGVSRRARVYAESQGDLHMNLLPSPSDGHVHLEARSSQGDIVLLIPRSYRGAIQLSTQHGEAHFLPQLSQAMRTALWTHDKKIIILGGWHTTPVTPTTPSTASSSSNATQVLDDFCKLQAWRGSIYIGFAGEEVPRPERNLSQRSGRRRWGEEEDDQVSSRGRYGATPLLRSLIHLTLHPHHMLC